MLHGQESPDCGSCSGACDVCVVFFGIARKQRAPQNLNAPSVAEKGKFITLKSDNGNELRAFVAGPADANAGILVVHDYLGISESTRQSVEHLGVLGYRTIAVDLYGGKSATNHEEAVKLMQSLNRQSTDKILQAGLDYLKQPGRKIATLGFSMGGLESLNANLNDPDAVIGTPFEAMLAFSAAC